MKKLEIKSNLGDTGLKLPPIVFGTSCLGNLYNALADDLKLNIGLTEDDFDEDNPNYGF